MIALTEAHSAHLVVLADYRRRRTLERWSPWIAAAALVLLVIALASMAGAPSATVPAGDEAFPWVLID